MNLIQIGNEIVNLDHLTRAHRDNSGTVALYFPSAGSKELANVVTLRKEQGEKVWNLLMAKRTGGDLGE